MVFSCDSTFCVSFFLTCSFCVKWASSCPKSCLWASFFWTNNNFSMSLALVSDLQVPPTTTWSLTIYMFIDFCMRCMVVFFSCKPAVVCCNDWFDSHLHIAVAQVESVCRLSFSVHMDFLKPLLLGYSLVEISLPRPLEWTKDYCFPIMPSWSCLLLTHSKLQQTHNHLSLYPSVLAEWDLFSALLS